MKILKSLLKLIFVVIILAGILFITSKILEEKIVDKAITILNNQINVPVYIDNVSFSLLKKFPNATLQLNNVTLFSAKGFNRSDFHNNSADTLVFIDELYLSLNLPSLLDNKLNITKAYIQDGIFNILVDKKGNENFRVLNSVDTANVQSDSSKNNFELLLNKIKLNSVEINFINRYKNTSISIYAPEYSISGQFYKKSYAAHSKGKMLLNYFVHNNIKLYPKLPTNINADINVDNQTINILKGSLENRDYQFETSGKITLGTPMKIDIKLTGNSNNIDKLVRIFDSKSTLSTKGQIGISTLIRGNLSSKKNPAIAANFKLINGSIINKSNNFTIDAISLDGSYSNGKSHSINTSSLKIKQFAVVKDKSKITGNLSIVDFNNPNIRIKGTTNLYLHDIDNLLPNDKSFTIDGKAGGDFYCNGSIDISKNFLKQFAVWRKTGDFKITDGKYVMDKQLSITDIDGTLNIRNNYVSITGFTGTIQNSKVTGDILSLNNYLSPAISPEKPIYINANVSADNIKYADYEHFFIKDEDDSDSATDIIIKGKVKADKLLYKNIVARDVSGTVNYKKDILQISDLNFKTMGGEVSSEIKYLIKSENKSVFQTYTLTKDININTLFGTFNNFGQTLIKQENISGYLNTNFNLEMTFINGELKMSSIDFLGHMLINNGKLINFKPIEEVAKFSDINEIKNIKFSTLETDILIGSNTINIPKTEIRSNAFDLSLYGVHKFNGDYEYHMKIYLTDFIKGKSKQLAQQQSEFGYIKDDGYGKAPLFLLVTNTNGVSKVKLDGSEIKQNLKNNLKEEKYEFKKALHDQFGWFKKDTTLNKEDKKQESPGFIIEWDEE